MKISCTNMMAEGKTLTEKALFLRKCGFDGISVFADIDFWDDKKEDELLNLEKNTGIKVCEFCFSGGRYGKLMSEDHETAKAAKKLYQKAIHIGNKLGAISEMEYQYGRFEEPPLYQIYQKMNVVEKERFCRIFTELAGELSGEAKLLLEPINRYESRYLNTIEDNLQIIKELNLPGTGLLADIFHMSIEERDICEALYLGRGYIKHIHLGDSNRLLPGKGRLDWKAIFDTLREIKYDGYINLECALSETDHEKELSKQVEFLEKYI